MSRLFTLLLACAAFVGCDARTERPRTDRQGSADASEEVIAGYEAGSLIPSVSMSPEDLIQLDEDERWMDARQNEHRRGMKSPEIDKAIRDHAAKQKMSVKLLLRRIKGEDKPADSEPELLAKWEEDTEKLIELVVEQGKRLAEKSPAHQVEPEDLAFKPLWFHLTEEHREMLIEMLAEQRKADLEPTQAQLKALQAQLQARQAGTVPSSAVSD